MIVPRETCFLGSGNVEQFRLRAATLPIRRLWRQFSGGGRLYRTLSFSFVPASDCPDGVVTLPLRTPMKRHYLVSCLITIPVGVLSAQAQSPAAQLPPSSAQQTPVTVSSVCGTGGTYDQLTDPWRHAASPQYISLGTAPIELTIQSTEFSDLAVTEKITSVPEFCSWNTLSVGVNVSTAGEIFGFANGEGEDRGTGGGKLSADAFAQLESSMGNLPDDGHRVPPPERRVLVVVQKSGSVTVRIYLSPGLLGETHRSSAL